MSWIILVIAGLFEVSFAFCLGKFKTTTGLNANLWFIGFLICLFISMYLLMLSIKNLPIGTAYATWTGIGSVGSVLIGIIFFNEPMFFWRLFFLSTLIISIVGLKVVS